MHLLVLTSGLRKESVWIREKACREEVLLSIKRACFDLLLFSTPMCKLNLVEELFEVSLGVHCCCSVFLICVVKK